MATLLKKMKDLQIGDKIKHYDQFPEIVRIAPKGDNIEIEVSPPFAPSGISMVTYQRDHSLYVKVESSALAYFTVRQNDSYLMKAARSTRQAIACKLAEKRDLHTDESSDDDYEDLQVSGTPKEIAELLREMKNAEVELDLDYAWYYLERAVQVERDESLDIDGVTVDIESDNFEAAAALFDGLAVTLVDETNGNF